MEGVRRVNAKVPHFIYLSIHGVSYLFGGPGTNLLQRMMVVGYEVIICTSYTMSEGSVIEDEKAGKVRRTWNCRGEDLNFSIEWGSQGGLHLEAEN